MAMDCFTKLLEAYPILNQDASTVAEAPFTNFCRFGVPRELHSFQSHKFESRVMQDVLECLGMRKTRITPLRPKLDGVVERYVKTVEEHQRKVFVSHQMGGDARLRIFLLAYKASTHDSTGLTPANLVFGRELRLPSYLLF
jgi:hypothetical protein